MTAPDYTAINAKPETLLSYLENNILLSGFLKNSQANSMPEHIEFEPSTTTVAKKGNSSVDAFKLRNSTQSTTSKALKAYICDYTAGGIEYCRLGSAANFCFTITMNGCTFGVGQTASDGTVIVTHANKGGKTIDQQQQTFTTHGTKDVSMMEPALYRRAGRNMNATTFGIRVNGKWKFYFQSYSVSSGVYTLVGVFPVPVQQFSST